MSTRTGPRGDVPAPAIERRRAAGAGVQPDDVYFRVWAPRRTAVDAVIAESETDALSADRDGCFSGVIARSAIALGPA